MHISTNGLHLIEGFEGWSSGPYWDSYGGVWTRGYGETEGIGANSPHISQSYGEQNLRYRIERFYEWALNGLHVGLNQNQWDALCSFIWNLGPGVLEAGTHMGALLRSRQFHIAADAMLEYDHAGGVVLEGLARRRRAERALFLAGVEYTEVNPMSLLTTAERNAVIWFDKYNHHKWRHYPQWRKVRGQIIRLRQDIWYAAERGIYRGRPVKRVKKGWHIHHRAERYNILRSRVR
jgi:lysozyme